MPVRYTKEGHAVLVGSSRFPPPPPSPTPPATTSSGDKWGLEGSMLRDGSDAMDSEDAYLVVDDQFQVNAADRSEIVQCLYEGSRTCQCCINWVDERPADLEEEKDEAEKIDDKVPILVRRKRICEGSKYFHIHSIEIQSASLRMTLAKVFDRYDQILPFVRYLTFLAPFRPFYWRWKEFEQAIKEEKDEKLVKQLKCIRDIVKLEIFGALTISRELQDNGIISYHFLWTLYKPGELLYSKEDGKERFYVLDSAPNDANPYYTLNVKFLDWNGSYFGFANSALQLHYFTGSKRITDLKVFPARFLDDLEKVKERVVARGKKIVELAGVHHKSYRRKGIVSGNKTAADLRIVIDAQSHPSKPLLGNICEQDDMPLCSGMITQTPPVSEPPPGGHIPLDSIPMHKAGRSHRKHMLPYNVPSGPLPPPPPVADIPFRNGRATSGGIGSLMFPPDDLDEERQEIELSKFHLLLANPIVRGFRLKDKEWAEFDVHQVHEIDWNADSFDTLVLPDGYKDLIIAHVESQLKKGENFDDVISGKGGGLVVLLSGPPGVGKTLTVESIAERMRAPLYKMELREDSDKSGAKSPEFDLDERVNDIEHSFDLAMKWDSVLLLDECDTYLQKRSDHDARRNNIVTTFLRKLEYYPSLLFLTTNRADKLDIALQSRVHLTISYPELDVFSRLSIWRNFLSRAGSESELSSEEIERLAQIDLNGRRIRNVIKTALVMAKKQNRGLRYADVEKVLMITEGLTLKHGD